MENQDNNRTGSHPKPADNAQSLVETIVPSSEDKPSTTTKAETEENTKQDVKDSPGEKAGDDENEAPDKIETVAP